jgi:hypothetical protein
MDPDDDPAAAAVAEGRDEFNRALFVNLLGREWLPAIAEGGSVVWPTSWSPTNSPPQPPNRSGTPTPGASSPACRAPWALPLTTDVWRFYRLAP